MVKLLLKKVRLMFRFLLSISLVVMFIAGCGSGSSQSPNLTAELTEVNATILIGLSDSYLALKDINVGGLELLKADNADCNVSDIGNCVNPQVLLVEAKNTVTADFFNINTAPVSIWLKNGSKVSRRVNTKQLIFSGRQSHQVVVFNNKMWVIGGIDAGVHQNDVWSSAGGTQWYTTASFRFLFQ